MLIPKPASSFTTAEKVHVILEYLNGAASKNEIWQKYTGKQDHPRLLTWMRKLGYHTHKIVPRKAKFSQKALLMAKQKQASQKQTDPDPKNLSHPQWQAKLKALEEALEVAQMKAQAYSAMIDIAEKEFQIPIRKK